MEPSNDISHSVRDAFQELGHKARVAATSAYVALPVLMASAPSIAYGHETGQEHAHWYDPTKTKIDIASFAVMGLGVALFGRELGKHLNDEDKDVAAVRMAAGALTSLVGISLYAFNNQL